MLPLFGCPCMFHPSGLAVALFCQQLSCFAHWSYSSWVRIGLSFYFYFLHFFLSWPCWTPCSCTVPPNVLLSLLAWHCSWSFSFLILSIVSCLSSPNSLCNIQWFFSQPCWFFFSDFSLCYLLLPSALLPWSCSNISQGFIAFAYSTSSSNLFLSNTMNLFGMLRVPCWLASCVGRISIWIWALRRQALDLNLSRRLLMVGRLNSKWMFYFIIYLIVFNQY